MGGGRGKGSSSRPVSPLRQQLKDKEYRKLTEFIENESLEPIINKTSKKLLKKGYPVMKAAARSHPYAYAGLIFLEVAYRNRKIIRKSIEKTEEIWKDDKCPISDKIQKTGYVAVDTTKKVIKKEGKKLLREGLSNLVAEKGAEILDNVSVIESVASATGLEQHEDKFKDLLKDTIQKETSKSLNETGGNNE